MILTVLASGSHANCSIVSSGSTRIIVDCGLPVKECLKRMAAEGIDPSEICGAILTHSHIDHSRGVQIASRLGIPLYATKEEIEAIQPHDCMAFELTAGKRFTIRDIEVTPFDIPHDSPRPVAFAFEDGGEILAYGMDMGSVPDDFAEALRASRTIFLESNHDTEAAGAGSLPLSVKRRIMGPLGHLSNTKVGDMLRTLTPRTKRIVLGHISTMANSSALVAGLADQALAEVGLSIPVEVV